MYLFNRQIQKTHPKRVSRTYRILRKKQPLSNASFKSGNEAIDRQLAKLMVIDFGLGNQVEHHAGCDLQREYQHGFRGSAKLKLGDQEVTGLDEGSVKHGSG